MTKVKLYRCEESQSVHAKSSLLPTLPETTSPHWLQTIDLIVQFAVPSKFWKPQQNRDNVFGNFEVQSVVRQVVKKGEKLGNQKVRSHHGKSAS